MSINRIDFAFCLPHKLGWHCGENLLGHQKEVWYTDEIAKRNLKFLKDYFSTD
jgi:hypothetical protein